MSTFDVAIVGGGLVGASLVAALDGLGLSVALIEAVPLTAAAQPSFDERTTALSNGSRRILETLGVWPSVAAFATPIAKIHVSDQGRFGFARVDAAEQGLAALGYVAPNRVLGAALWSKIGAAEGVRVYCPALLRSVVPGAQSIALTVAESSVESVIEARLVVAADGAQSAVRAAFNVAAEVRDYAQTAVIATVLPQRFHDHVAYERFTEEGPVALLPLAEGRCALIFTVNSTHAGTAMAWSDRQFLAEVQRRFGFRLGRFLEVGRRTSYPLSLTRAERTSAQRCIFMGNAAQGMHPVAGMGFNLGLRDAACLAELLALLPPGSDAGDASMLSQYDAWRAADRRGIIAFTDGLVRIFGSPLGAVRRLRDLGLLAFDLLPQAKSALSRLSTGASGRIPKLARGVSLR